LYFNIRALSLNIKPKEYFMLRHIVMWKLKEAANGKSKAENAVELKARLTALKDKINELKRIEVGIHIQPQPANNWDVALVTDFANAAALDVYQQHPAHQEVVGFVKQIVETRSAVDYEV
jgi:hypothetical protein